jgi:Ni/Fe-hydrogenase 1 B-type cytochrome subunit
VSAAETMPKPELVRVYVWDVVVRVTHWLIVLAILVLATTGFYIGRPFQAHTGPATPHFLMGWMRTIHFYTAIVFTVSVLARIVWMFIGTRWARWTELVPVTRDRQVGLVKTLKFYLMLFRKPPDYVGHNPLAGASYGFIFLLFLVEVATGSALYGASATTSFMHPFASLLPWLGGAQIARWIHHAVMWLLLGFMVHHVYSAILTSIVEKNGELDSIFSGNKFVEPHVLQQALDRRRT